MKREDGKSRARSVSSKGGNAIPARAVRLTVVHHDHRHVDPTTSQRACEQCLLHFRASHAVVAVLASQHGQVRRARRNRRARRAGRCYPCGLESGGDGSDDVRPVLTGRRGAARRRGQTRDIRRRGLDDPIDLVVLHLTRVREDDELAQQTEREQLQSEHLRRVTTATVQADRPARRRGTGDQSRAMSSAARRTRR